MAGKSSERGIDPRRDRCRGLEGAVAVLLVAGRAEADIDWEGADSGEIVQRLAAAGILEMPADDRGGVVITVPQDKLMVVAVRRDTEARKAEEVNSPEVPQYDQATHELLWRGQVVRHWERESERQEAVLLAFQQAGWPESIANPFAAEAEAAEILRQRVKNLNRGLPSGTVHFNTDGHGRVCWIGK